MSPSTLRRQAAATALSTKYERTDTGHASSTAPAAPALARRLALFVRRCSTTVIHLSVCSCAEGRPMLTKRWPSRASCRKAAVPTSELFVSMMPSQQSASVTAAAGRFFKPVASSSLACTFSAAASDCRPANHRRSSAASEDGTRPPQVRFPCDSTKMPEAVTARTSSSSSADGGSGGCFGGGPCGDGGIAAGCSVNMLWPSPAPEAPSYTGQRTSTIIRGFVTVARVA